MLFIQAILVGIFSYLGAIQTPWAGGITGDYYILGRPLVAGLICGLIFGNITEGVILGVAVQAAFIANISTGGSTNSEIVYASYGGIGLALVSNASTGVAVSLAVLTGSLGLLLYNLIMVENSFWNARATKAASHGDTKGMFMNHVVGAQVVSFVIRAVPTAVAIYFGKPVVSAILNNVPQQVIHMMDVLGGLLPALGVALLMNLLINDKLHFIFFLAGFAFLAFISKSMIALAIIAAMVAYIIYISSGNDKGKKSTGKTLENIESDIKDDGVI